jgi:hypothetical protein
MFSDAATPLERTDRFERYIGLLGQSIAAGKAGETRFLPGRGLVRQDPLMAQLARPEVRQAIGSDALRVIESQLARPGLMQDWTNTNPISDGLVAYDLEAPAKMLFPRPTPWRNMLPRIKGVGTVHRAKVISGISGTGTGGTTPVNPGITDSTQTEFVNLNLLRGPKIGYAGYDQTAVFLVNSLSDSVFRDAFYQAQGYQDLHQLSQTALLYASMLSEERLAIYGRGTTANGYTGALATPTVTVSAVTAAAGQTAVTAGTYYVAVTADGGQLGTNHESVPTAIQSVTVSTGDVIKIVVSVDSPGALGYNLYAGTANALASLYYQGRTGYNNGFITGTINSAGIQPVSTDTSAPSATPNYDGVMTNLAANGGYVNRLNAPFNTATPGVEFENAFGVLYDGVKADPEDVWMNGHDRKQLSDLLRNSASNNYRFQVMQDESGRAVVGSIVTGILNPFSPSGKIANVQVHPWFPQGNATINSWELPIPDTEVSQTVAFVNVQDYMGIDWAPIQLTDDTSSYWIGTMFHYAPLWSGLIQGIQLV